MFLTTSHLKFILIVILCVLHSSCRLFVPEITDHSCKVKLQNIFFSGLLSDSSLLFQSDSQPQQRIALKYSGKVDSFFVRIDTVDLIFWITKNLVEDNKYESKCGNWSPYLGCTPSLAFIYATKFVDNEDVLLKNYYDTLYLPSVICGLNKYGEKVRLHGGYKKLYQKWSKDGSVAVVLDRKFKEIADTYRVYGIEETFCFENHYGLVRRCIIRSVLINDVLSETLNLAVRQTQTKEGTDLISKYCRPVKLILDIESSTPLFELPRVFHLK